MVTSRALDLDIKLNATNVGSAFTESSLPPSDTKKYLLTYPQNKPHIPTYSTPQVNKNASSGKGKEVKMHRLVIIKILLA